MVRIIASALALTFLAAIAAESQATFSTYQQRVAVVTSTPGWVAFWDFVKREPDGAHRFIAHVPQGATNDFALDAGNYVKDYWSFAMTFDDERDELTGWLTCRSRCRRGRALLWLQRSRAGGSRRPHGRSMDVRGTPG